MRTKFAIVIMLIAVATLAACDREARMSEQGFRLPDGDAVAGRTTFVYMQCHQCHSVVGEEFPEIPGQDPPYVALGGPTAKVKTYGELITAIINQVEMLFLLYLTGNYYKHVNKLPIKGDSKK